MSASVMDDVAIRVSDYEDSEGRVISRNRGPIAVCCNKPHMQCTCPAPIDLPGSQTETPNQRQATALEMIAVSLHKIVKHLEAQTPEPVHSVGSIPINIGSDVPIELPKRGPGRPSKAEVLEKLKEVQ